MRAFLAEYVSNVGLRAAGLAIAYSLLTSVTPARADEPPPAKTETKSDGVDEAAYELPKLKFVEVDKPYVVDANQLREELAQWIKTYAQAAKTPPVHPDQPQFVAELRIAAPRLYVEVLQVELDNMLKETSGKHPLESWVAEFFHSAGFSSNPLYPVDAKQPRPQYFGYLRFSQHELDMPTAGPSVPWRDDNSSSSGIVDSANGRVFRRAKGEVFLLAKTKGRAEELAKAFIELVNQGKALPGRIQSLAWKKAADAELIEVQKKLADAQGDLDKQDKALKALGDAPVVASDTLKELKTKKVVLSVDRAGVAARVAAAEKMMKAALDNPAGLKSGASFNSVKESAEIELAGLTGQTVEIDRLIDNSAKRIAVERDRTIAIIDRDKALVEVQKAEAIVAAQEANIKATAPVELLDEAIPIRPVQLQADGGK